MLYVIVGGSSELGSTVCKELSSMGHKVLSTSSGHKPYNPILSIDHVSCDVTDHEACIILAEKAFSISSRISLVYMPARSVNSMCHKMKKSDWNAVLDVSLGGAFSISAAFLKKMREVSFGRLVYIGSITGRVGVPGTVAYSAAKEGLKGLVRVISNENASHNITANYLELGYMAGGLTYTIPETIRNKIVENIPARALGNPSEITDAILLLSNSNYINGAVLSITGGL